MKTSRIILLVILICLAHTLPVHAQEHTTGIFAIIQIEKKGKTKGYGRRVFNRSHRERFLIPEQPLIASAEFKAVSEITHELRTMISYFSITVSTDGLARLRNTIQALTDTELVLLIDNTVFGRISSKSENDFLNDKITIVSPIKDADLQWAHEKLDELLKARQQ
ncbi:MAG: hypothetical protein KIT62_16490 [Cyclobacteriaceae bacterium]|nr:hypothetical protein [Cyclobacteriaceae bacterium]